MNSGITPDDDDRSRSIGSFFREHFSFDRLAYAVTAIVVGAWIWQSWGRIKNDDQHFINEGRAAVELLKKGDYHSALAHANAAVNLNPNNAGIRDIRGLIHEGLLNYDQAISDQTEAIRLGPPDWRCVAEAYGNRASVLSKKGEHERAISDCSEAIRLDPDVWSFYQTRWLAYRDAAKQLIEEYRRSGSEDVRGKAHEYAALWVKDQEKVRSLGYDPDRAKPLMPPK